MLVFALVPKCSVASVEVEAKSLFRDLVFVVLEDGEVFFGRWCGCLAVTFASLQHLKGRCRQLLRPCCFCWPCPPAPGF